VSPLDCPNEVYSTASEPTVRRRSSDLSRFCALLVQIHEKCFVDDGFPMAILDAMSVNRLIRITRLNGFAKYSLA